MFYLKNSNKNIQKEEFKKMVELETLKWLPFIGEKHLKVPAEHRMLIIGESHYQLVSNNQFLDLTFWTN